MLETIREYSLEKLAESGETDESRRRHLEYFISLAESANLSDLNDDEQRMHLVLPERNNIRAALEWALGADEIDLGLTLVVTLEGYWVAASPLEGTRWLGTLLPRARQAPDEQRARALGAWGHAAAMAGEYEEAERLHEMSLAAFRRLGDDRGAATVLQRLAMDAMARGDVERAQVCVDESLRLYRSKLAEALALRTYGFIEWQAGNHERAVELFEQSAALAGEAGQTWLQASFLLHRAELLLEQGRLAFFIHERPGRAASRSQRGSPG
jgi:non-specific serine/threonine protein kinase